MLKSAHLKQQHHGNKFPQTKGKDGKKEKVKQRERDGESKSKDVHCLLVLESTVGTDDEFQRLLKMETTSKEEEEGKKRAQLTCSIHMQLQYT